MKKRIRVAVKKLICLVTICAMTVGACPIPITAAEEEGVTVVTEVSTEENAEKNTKQIIKKEQSEAVQKSMAAVEDAAQEVREEESESSEITTQQKSESVSEEVSEEVITTEEDPTSEEVTTTEEDPTSEEVTTTEEDPTSEEVTTTEEDSTSEEVTTTKEERTTKEGLTLEKERMTKVNAVDTVELIVNGVGVSKEAVEYQYESRNGESRFFTMEVGGSADITVHAEEINEEVCEVAESLVDATSIMLVMEGPDGMDQTIAGTVEVDENLNVTTSVSKEFELKAAGEYKFYIVVKDAYGNEKYSNAITQNITIPSPIGVVVENPVISVSEAEQYPTTGIATAFDIPSSVSFDIRLTGLDGDVSSNQRSEEIRKVLAQCKAYIGTENVTSVEKTLEEEQLVNKLSASEGSTVAYSIGGNIRIARAGEHVLFAMVSGVAAENVKTTVEKLSQSLSYISEQNEGKPYSFREDVVCELSSDSIHAGNVIPVVTDEAGERISNREVLVLPINGKYLVKAMNPHRNQNKTYTITFYHSGNDIYANAETTLNLDFVRSTPKIVYNLDLKKDSYRYDDQITYTLSSNHVAAENVEYYESDEQGVPIIDAVLNIKRDENKFIITADNSDSKNYETNATHYITFKFLGDEGYGCDTQTFALDYARVKNEISYTSSSDDVIHEHGEGITYYYNAGQKAGGISCYQSDKDGNRLDDRDDLSIEVGDKGSFKVSGKNLSPEGEPFYVTIAHAENGVYLANHQTFEFHVTKIDLKRNIDVQELENGIFFKTRKMYVDVFVSAQHNNLREDDVDNIAFDLTATLKSDSQTPEAMKYKKPVVSYDSNVQAYRFRYEIDKEYAHALKANGEYEIEAVAKFEVDYFKDFSVVYDSVVVKRSSISLTVDGETSRSMEYSKDIKSISYRIQGENFAEYPVACTAHIDGDKTIEVVSIDNNSMEYNLLKAGKTKLILTVDDDSMVSKYDAHEEIVVEIDITVTSPSNTDYTINGKTPEAFLEAAVTIPNTDEKWYKDDITFSFGENNLYTQICYSADKGKNWTTKNIEEFIIGETMPTDYEFYFCNTEVGIRSSDVKPNMFFTGIAVDQTNPSWNTTLVIDQTPSVHSNETISYFPTGIIVTGYAGTEVGSDKKVDAGAGIEKVYVQYGNSDIWEEIALDDRYSSSYTLALDENKNYGTIRLKTVDYLGHESEVAEYAKAVCVDDVTPVVVAVTVDEEGQIADYDGTWTNQQLRYAVDLLQKPQVSGIHKYEYAFVLRGTAVRPEEVTEWTEIDQDELEVIFGTFAGDSENYARKNGTLYFRAQSNAGLTTSKEDIINQQKEIRIWQEDLEGAKVMASVKPDAKTGWYNAQTGEVSISFEYPEYDEKNCAPAVGIVYTFATKASKEGEASSTTSKFFKGIFAEKTDAGVVENVLNDDLTKGTITINRDSMNTLTVHVEDAAGNRSEVSEFEYKADFIVPDILSATVGGADITIHKDDATGALYTKFSQNALTVDSQAEYGISEKQNFYMAITQEQGGKAALSGSNLRDTLNIEPCTRGYVYLCAVDGAGNQSEAWTDGIVVDNQAPTGGSQQEISIVTKGMNSAEFFNEDIEVSLKVVDAPAKDHYSGLKNVTYTLGRDNQNTEGNITVFESQSASLTWNNIAKNHGFETDNIIIDAAKNESNHAYIQVTATDYAGNTSTITKELQIDVTNPQIEISFEQSNALKETYYNSNRVARIEVKELNFDPSQVSFVIYKDGKEDPTLIPAAGSWNTSDGNRHSTYITFSEDGDYSFEVQCTDLAGNKSQKAVSETFTIDKTKPVVEVAYDNNNAWKANYYSQARTATITVVEHNFDARDFEASVAPQAVLGSWTHNEDVHRVTIHFDQEEHYSYRVNYTDLAGNTMDAFTEEEFYIDMNSPVIQISGVEDHSANAGDVIPVVTVSDKNYDIEGVQMSLQNSKGQQIAVMYSVTMLDSGYSYILTNVNEQPDEIYTLTVIATDMAGNESELTYHFSLNRNGSVYDLSQMSALVEKAYMRYIDVEDLHIYEMNVNTIEEFNIIVTRNGQVITSMETDARPYDGAQDAIYYTTNVEGSDAIGYEYEYTIYRESFWQEGIYNIMFYSRDKAGNEVNNTLTEKEAEITFVVDNTVPNVVVEGVESGELYTEETKDINVYVSDNFKLQEAYFKLVDEDRNVIQTYNYMELAEEEGEIVTITLPSSNKKMSIQYYALDVAGNDIATMQDEAVATSFMITTNAWIRYINNQKAVAGTICVAVVVVVAVGVGVFFRRRRKA